MVAPFAGRSCPGMRGGVVGWMRIPSGWRHPTGDRRAALGRSRRAHAGSPDTRLPAPLQLLPLGRQRRSSPPRPPFPFRDPQAEEDAGTRLVTPNPTWSRPRTRTGARRAGVGAGSRAPGSRRQRPRPPPRVDEAAGGGVWASLAKRRTSPPGQPCTCGDRSVRVTTAQVRDLPAAAKDPPGARRHAGAHPEPGARPAGGAGRRRGRGGARAHPLHAGRALACVRAGGPRLVRRRAHRWRGVVRGRRGPPCAHHPRARRRNAGRGEGSELSRHRSRPSDR